MPENGPLSTSYAVSTNSQLSDKRVPSPIIMHAPAPSYAPPRGHPPSPSPTSSEALIRNVELDTREAGRSVVRTPSPTPSEARALTGERRQLLIQKLFDPKVLSTPKGFIRNVGIMAIIALLILLLVYQDEIEEWLRPAGDWMKSRPGGWLIPIAIMFVMSFPPLFGHEIIAILCGNVWGLWIGFGIVCAATLLGEVANFVVFAFFCGARSRKLEEKNYSYASLAEVVRAEGFPVILALRYSYIPGHLSTAVFASTGVGILTFTLAAFLSLPKQLAVVFLGVNSVGGVSGHTAQIVKGVVIGVTVALTILAMKFVQRKQKALAPELVYRRRKLRQAKMLAATGMPPFTPSNYEFGAEAPAASRGAPARTEPAYSGGFDSRALVSAV